MKTTTLQKISLSAALLLTLVCKSQTIADTVKKSSSNPQNRFAIGYNLSQYQKDFGVGINLTSPYVAKFMAFRLVSNMQWFENIPNGETNFRWNTYYNFRFGVVTRQFLISNKISLYSEGGLIAILPNSNTSSVTLKLGGYGLFGFEFHPSPNFSQFIETGGIGTDAVADKLPGNPIYCNGFLVSAGFRIHF